MSILGVGDCLLLRNRLLPLRKIQCRLAGPGALEEMVDRTSVLVIVEQVDVIQVVDVLEPALLGGLLGLEQLVSLPVFAHLLDLLLEIKLGVVVLANTPEALPHGQVLRVDGNAMVVLSTAIADEVPAAFLLLEIQSRRVWQKN